MTENAPAETEALPAAGRWLPSDWVPVERRWFGFDRRTLRPTLIVAAVALAMNLIVPAIDDAIPTDDPIRAGDEVVLRDEVSFAPAAGWNLDEGVRRDEVPSAGNPPARAVVTSGDTSFEVITGTFDGDARQLLAQIKDTTDALNDSAGLHVTGDPVTITTEDGVRGLLSRFNGTASEGVLAAFVVDDVGVEIVATSPPTAGRPGEQDTIQQVAAMITSLTFGDGSDS
ncbi:hypothetical protein [Jiangella alba]|uniref:Uncharacterized protein n=1 Tax=Jiangella alba TaxID=561176 RepID=A0A1H5JDH6_9ACTN|nr:hypothetical protein [Jiangella alba]SEE50603.1 hypothetical protein SAMN04488561_1542 [Jiangella alba]